MHLEKDFTGDIKRAEVMEHQENKKEMEKNWMNFLNIII